MAFSTDGLAIDGSTAARSLAAPDLDGDGRADLALATRRGDGSSALEVLLSRPGGSFQPLGAWSLPVEALAASDLDGDGDSDLAAAGGDAVTVLWNDSGRLAEGERHVLAEGLSRLAAADLDQDGLGDLVAASALSGRLWVLRQAAPGAFEPAELEAGERPTGIAAVDLDQDGLVDLAVANRVSQEVTLHFNLGSGSFAEAVRVSVPGLELPQAIAALDVDLDGDGDLAVLPDLALLVYRNGGRGVLEEEAALALPGVSFSLGAQDLEGDGDTDLAVGFSGGEPSLRVFLSDGRGRLILAGDTILDVAPRRLAAGDLDGDGDTDLVVGGPGPRVAVIRNIIAHGLPMVFEAIAALTPHDQALADLDGDGFLDLVVAHGGTGSLSVFLNDRAGRLAGGVRRVAAVDRRRIATGDVDGDGDADVLAAGTGHFLVLLNDGRGALSSHFSDPTLGFWELFLAAADVDGDGRLDAVSTTRETRGVLLRRGRGDGTFDAPETVEAASEPAAVAPSDIDSDGDLDLAVANGRASLLTVHWNQG